MATFIRILGIFITVIFSTGATIGAMITMYGSVANRTVEIGTLRALGFFRRSICWRSHRSPSALSFAGGLVGARAWLDAAVLHDIHAELRLVFRVGFFLRVVAVELLRTSLGFSLLMGLLGGFLPAVRAARLDIIQALRAV